MYTHTAHFRQSRFPYRPGFLANPGHVRPLSVQKLTGVTKTVLRHRWSRHPCPSGKRVSYGYVYKPYLRGSEMVEMQEYVLGLGVDSSLTSSAESPILRK